jgi:hypothetical protein
MTYLRYVVDQCAVIVSDLLQADRHLRSRVRIERHRCAGALVFGRKLGYHAVLRHESHQR